MRAVLAEDHPAMAQQLHALISSDCDVQIVQDAQSLMAAFELEMPDIVITDITMPGKSGRAAARDILAAPPEARKIRSHSPKV
ncbi:response regulator [Bradyrhizobium sp. NP1]|uniref:response regulator n=1 Tax=Bradyrhizobium sp. NP1 TaxID=3049772 RepID=UPI0025A59A2C|nr:response regulator [Bradyrhizobium sp. NP1]WJR76740.1 response regulator [Bradyrhizobium sp. NP1]